MKRYLKRNDRWIPYPTRTEVKVKCLACNAEKWVVWEVKHTTHCRECPEHPDKEKFMKAMIIPTYSDEPANTFVTREVEI